MSTPRFPDLPNVDLRMSLDGRSTSVVVEGFLVPGLKCVTVKHDADDPVAVVTLELYANVRTLEVKS